MTLIDLCERRLIPDPLTRLGMRRVIGHRWQAEHGRDRRAVLRDLAEGPLALATDDANDQHYELPPEFFVMCLGEHRKYSCGWWDENTPDLTASEARMLQITCERAGIEDGMDILELGCGWGSLTLWMAEHYPNARITAVSNSAPQRRTIEQRLADRGCGNAQILTADMNDFSIDQRFDRVVSVEMFEHMHNYAELLRRVRSWLKDDGRLFVHIFCHREFVYPFLDESNEDWMARYFFTGGLMPSYDIFTHFPDDLQQLQSWWVPGGHYEKTSNAWLKKMDAHQERGMTILQEHYGDDAALWWQRWRMFYMAVAELFGYRNGEEWGVGHYLLGPAR